MEAFDILISALRRFTDALDTYSERLNRLEANLTSVVNSKGDKIMAGINEVNAALDRAVGAAASEAEEIKVLLQNAINSGATKAELDKVVERLNTLTTNIQAISEAGSTPAPADPGV